MAVLADSSRKRLATCHADLKLIVEMVAKDFPLMVVCGHRDQMAQDAAYAAKTSKLKWPNSRHNTEPSGAVDLAPLPLKWNDKKSFFAMAKVVKAAADKLGIEIECGADWAMADLDHFQLRIKPSLADPGK